MSEVITKTVVELEKLGLYRELEKAYVDAGLAKKWESATFDEATRKVSFYTVPQPSGETAPVFEFTLPEVDFTEVNAAIKANSDAIDILNGTGVGSVSKQVSDAVAKIVADAPEAYDTLKEISDWISSHTDDAAAMNSQINTNKTDIAGLKTLIGTLPEGVESTTIVEYIAEAIGVSSSDLTSAIATAKSEAITSANSYTDTEIGKTNANVSANATAIANAQADATSALEQIAAIQYATEEDIRGLFA